MDRYDSGDELTAIDLANLVYQFTYDYGKKTQSLFTICNLKKLMANATSPINPRNLLHDHPSLMLELGTQNDINYAKYKPLLDSGPNPFVEWISHSRWLDQPIFKSQDGKTLSRKNLIAAIRNEDGGAHGSRFLDNRLHDLKTMPLWESSSGQLRNPQYPMMRHIAYEVELSIRHAAQSL